MSLHYKHHSVKFITAEIWSFTILVSGGCHFKPVHCLYTVFCRLLTALYHCCAIITRDISSKLLCNQGVQNLYMIYISNLSHHCHFMTTLMVWSMLLQVSALSTLIWFPVRFPHSTAYNFCTEWISSWCLIAVSYVYLSVHPFLSSMY